MKRRFSGPHLVPAVRATGGSLWEEESFPGEVCFGPRRRRLRPAGIPGLLPLKSLGRLMIGKSQDPSPSIPARAGRPPRSSKMAGDPGRRPALGPGLGWTLLLLLLGGTSGDDQTTQARACPDFQNAGLLRGVHLNVQFLLFTPAQPSCGQPVKPDRSFRDSGFNGSLDTKIVIHGFRVLGSKPSWIDRLVRTVLRARPANVVAVDWVSGSTAAYFAAVGNVMKLSLEISGLIHKMLEMGATPSSIHIIGVSLGAHVGGMVGHFHRGQLGRITGLDPAGPEYTKASLEERLDPGDARFVDAIHTDTDCYGYMICDHMRAVYLYLSALENPCSLTAFPCSSYEDFLAGRCPNCSDPFLQACPKIGMEDQGGIKMEKLPKEVKVYLGTSAETPYCVFHSLVEFRMAHRGNRDTTVEVTFFSSNATSSGKVTIRRQQRWGRGVVTHPAPLCRVTQVKLRLHSFRRTWRMSEATMDVTFCAAPMPVNNREKQFCLAQPVTLKAGSSLFRELDVACD
ncbi:phospholipase A1 member A isoform X2 [Tachyglossus aculeatus]|uniref:phospholipase A1 member A isoform X2 n=1 Tax=Tachyglossus aculeatus TaxID=9261 RepID=UPI0018F3D10C|nr:phospholipase A1 member A isoform X2 [Tachyglossus aculeatus]